MESKIELITKMSQKENGENMNCRTVLFDGEIVFKDLMPLSHYMNAKDPVKMFFDWADRGVLPNKHANNACDTCDDTVDGRNFLRKLRLKFLQLKVKFFKILV